MAVTCQHVIDLALTTLGDSTESTWTATIRFEFLKTAIDLAYERQPHLFIGAYPFSGAGAFVIGTNIPFEDKFARPLSYYVIAMCQGIDSEYAVNGVASQYMGLFDREFPP